MFNTDSIHIVQISDGYSIHVRIASRDIAYMSPEHPIRVPCRFVDLFFMYAVCLNSELFDSICASLLVITCALHNSFMSELYSFREHPMHTPWQYHRYFRVFLHIPCVFMHAFHHYWTFHTRCLLLYISICWYALHIRFIHAHLMKLLGAQFMCTRTHAQCVRGSR